MPKKIDITMNPPRCLALNGAPSQYDRYLRLEDEAVLIDGRSEPQLLSFAVEFGRLLHFYNLDNTHDGDWSAFFLNDPTIALASVLAIDLPGLQARSIQLEKALSSRGPEDRKDAALRDYFQLLYDLALQFNAWLAGTQPLLHSKSARMFGGEVRQLLTNELGRALYDLSRHANEALAEAALAASPLAFDVFLPAWGLPQKKPADTASCAFPSLRKHHDFQCILRAILQMFLAALQRLREYAVRHLPDTLNESDHQPNAALYIVFVHLFRIAQKTVNAVTPRLAAFYYNDILQSRQGETQTETVYLFTSFARDDRHQQVTIARGTSFTTSGKSTHPGLTYAAREDVPISSATLELIRTLRVTPGKLCEGDLSSSSLTPRQLPVPVPVQIIASSINVDLINLEGSGKSPATVPLPWATFGNTVPEASAIEQAMLAAMGIAIASPYLMLTGGERTVSVTFTLATFSGTLTATLNELCCATGSEQGPIVEAILAGAFDLFLSTAGDWFLIPSYTVAYNASSSTTPASSFTITFILPASAPQVLPLSPSPDKSTGPTTGTDTANPDPLVPTLKLRLQQSPVSLPVVSGHAPVTTYPISTLRLFDLSTITLDTSTKGLSDLTLENTNGVVDASSPYPLFGTVPAVGSYLLLSNPELFVKVPAALTLSVEWYSLPPNSTGFKGYYGDYCRGMDGLKTPNLFDNTTFRCWIDVKKPGLWDIPAPNPTTAQLYLFNTMPPDLFNSPPPVATATIPEGTGTLARVTRFSSLPITPTPGVAFYSAADTALRLTLTAPAYSFGNLLYAPNVLNAVIDDLPSPTSSTPPPIIPDPDSIALRSVVGTLSEIPDKALSGSSTWYGHKVLEKYRNNVEEAVEGWQRNLLTAVQSYIHQHIVPLCGAYAAQVQTLLSTAATGYSSSAIATSLNAALETVAAQLPATSASIDVATACLDAIVSTNQALAQCTSDKLSQYKTCVKDEFTTLQAKVDSAMTPGSNQDTVLRYPNPPWLPQAKSIHIDYTASCSASPAGTEQVSFYYLLPFGEFQTPPPQAAAVPLLAMPDCSGQLLLGFSSLELPQTLNLLFNTVAGGFRHAPKVVWEHLENTWTPFDEDEEPANSTNGLQNTGIVSLSIPAPSSTTPQPSSSTAQRWIRACVDPPASLNAPSMFPETIGIYVNPIVADRVPSETGRTPQSTPAHTIKKPVEKLPGISEVHQPSDSFGGKPDETQIQMQTRQSERLRHKNRAILPWDYERLALEAFPSIWKVSAVPATGVASSDGTTPPPVSCDPGAILVVVVPGPSPASKDSTKPVATAQTLQQIAQFLIARASVFASIQVVNPNYISILVTATVTFATDEDAGGAADTLNADLVQYLSPWCYDPLRAAKSGNYTSQESIVQFIVTRTYVAQLDKIEFEYDGNCPDGWAFYTSAPKHRIRQKDVRPHKVANGHPSALPHEIHG
jgi:hypothetical protein